MVYTVSAPVDADSPVLATALSSIFPLVGGLVEGHAPTPTAHHAVSITVFSAAP